MSVERIPCPDTEQLAARVGGLGRKNSDFCLIFGIPSWLMPYVVAATEVCSRFIGTCRELSPPPSPSLSLSFFAFWVFLNGILRIIPFFLWCVPGRLFVAGNTCLFLFSPLPFSPSLFLSFFLSFLSSVPGCFCHSWEPFSSLPLVLWCVLGRMRRSWEHLPFFSFLFLFSPYPSLLSGP